MKKISIYIITDSNRRFLEVGTHTDLSLLMHELQQSNEMLFNASMRLNRLVYMENFHCEEQAEKRKRELQLYTRMQLEKIIRKANPNWNQLFANASPRRSNSAQAIGLTKEGCECGAHRQNHQRH